MYDAVDLLVTFPTEYPLEPLTIMIPTDQKLPNEFSTHLEEVITDHLLSTERAPGELMFQPFLKWLEVNIVSVLRDMPTAEENEGGDTDEQEGEESESESSVDGDDECDVSPDEEEETSSLQMLPAKRGTEVRLHGLQLSSAVGTVAVPNAKLVVSCTRCKTQCDVTMSAEK